MKEKNIPSKRIMEIHNDQALYYWNQLLDIQSKLLFPTELQFFFNSQEWMKANSILDAGCGNGSYLHNLYRYFPNKNYSGLDISKDLISIAINNYADSKIEFSNCNFSSFTPEMPVDLIIMRFVVQHMSGIQDVLLHASNILSEQGSLIIIEPDVEAIFTYPNIPLFQDFLARIEEHNRIIGTNRASLKNLIEEYEQADNWDLTNNTTLLSSHIGPFNEDPLLILFRLWIDIYENTDAFEFDYVALNKAIKDWSTMSSSYAQVGLNISHLILKSSNS